MVLLSSNVELLKKKLSGLTLLSPHTGHVSSSATCERVEEEEEAAQKISTTQSKFSCGSCDLTFSTVEVMRQHYKSAEHQARLTSKYLRQVSNEDYKHLEDLDEEPLEEEDKENSSESSTEESDKEEEVEFDHATFENEMKQLNMREEDGEKPLDNHLLRHSKLYFRNAEEEILALHKCLLITKKYRPSTLDELISAAETLYLRQKWAILMLSGGHFAAAVYDGAKMVCHKTFRRYTTRQKQGGVQSGRDAQGGKIRSAGATLRRHHEASLQREIQELLTSWRPELDGCSHIFLRAPARKLGIFQISGTAAKRQSANNQIPGPVFTSDDVRLRSVPVTSKRPTLEEIRRVHEQLSTVEIYDKDASLEFISMSANRQQYQKMKEQGDTPSTDRPNSSPKKKSEAESRRRRKDRRQAEYESALESRVDDEEEEVEEEMEITEEWRDFKTDLDPFDHSFGGDKEKRKTSESNAMSVWLNAVYTTAIYGDAEGLASCLRNSPETEERTLECLTRLHGSPGRTVLHDAVTGNSPEVVRILLDFGCRPDTPNEQTKLAYDLASKEIRTEMRRFMAEHPDKFDYKAARIPAPLSKEMEEGRKAKQAERRRQQRQCRKEKEQKKKEKEKERLEEEERRKSAAGPHCSLCDNPVTPKNRFEYYDFIFCSLRCLQTHRRQTKK